MTSGLKKQRSVDSVSGDGMSVRVLMMRVSVSTIKEFTSSTRASLVRKRIKILDSAVSVRNRRQFASSYPEMPDVAENDISSARGQTGAEKRENLSKSEAAPRAGEAGIQIHASDNTKARGNRLPQASARGTVRFPQSSKTAMLVWRWGGAGSAGQPAPRPPPGTKQNRWMRGGGESDEPGTKIHSVLGANHHAWSRWTYLSGQER